MRLLLCIHQQLEVEIDQRSCRNLQGTLAGRGSDTGVPTMV